VVHGLHGLAALRAARPDATIGWLVEDKAATLLENHPDVDRLHVYPRRRWRERFPRDPAGVVREAGAFLAGLRGARYEVAVDLQGNLKSGVLSALAGVPRRIGLARGCGKEANHLFVTEPVRVPREGFHRVDRVLRLLAPLGVDGPDGAGRIHVPAGDRAEVDAFLRDAGLSDGGYAVLHPGTSKRGIDKRWPPDRYGQLARRLLEEFHLRSVVTWGPGEEPLAARVAAASDGAAIPAPPLPRLSALGELARRAGLFVAGDTGALHLAAFLGTPTVGLHGPKHPDVYSARGPRTMAVFRGGDSPGPVSMTTITPDDVLPAVRALLLGPRDRTVENTRGNRCPKPERGRSAVRPAAGPCS
jgi:ADP-heptose:LPS heptosyltransferase